MPGTMEERVGRLHRDVQGQNRDLLVATVGVAVVGYARLGLVPDGDSGTAPAGWYVLGLMVAPSVRRLGVGEALLRGVVERAAVLGAGELWSFTDVRNAVSADLHRLVGFVEQRRGRIGFPGLPADSEDVLLRLLPIVPVVQRQLDRKLEPARAADAEPLLALREAAAAWLADRGIRQWQPGEASLADVRHQVQAGEWHVVREAEAPAAALRLLWQDEPVWGPQPPVAAYVHGLVVGQRHHGLGLGSAMLDWAGGQARARGRRLLRLDCGEDNQALRRYYGDQGFRAVGHRDFAGRWYSVVLLEQPL
jgi:ribosomal protein S18 acetylase RimI-like enzyme